MLYRYAAHLRENRRDGQYARGYLFNDPAACQYDDDGDVRVSHGTQTYHRANPLSQRDGVFRHWYGAVVVTGQWLQVNKSLSHFLGYSGMNYAR